MKSTIIFLLPFFAISLRDANEVRYKSINFAVRSLQTISLSMQDYKHGENFTYFIEPWSPYLPSRHYLEIKWTSFNVEGNLPTCKDYVEVYLTSSYKSIGKYCSDNMVDTKPFNMYSYDGYAKIVFKSNSSNTRSGFSLTYQLKSTSSSHMGFYSSACHGASPAAIFYSSGWPSVYLASSTPCWRTHYAGNNLVRVAVMDVSLYRTSSSKCYTNDSYFEIKASSSNYSSNSSIYSYGTSVSGRICGTKSPTFYTARKSYVYLYYNRPRSDSGYRGIMIGYMAYREKSSSPPSCIASFSVAISATVGSAVAILVWLQ
ncbi:tolloid-like protein 1 [Rhopilema esculentum]|uniref:tolloid-like protein 1 n=1 Tax=Rhopilema esculentum TaxID=499914 RepID=UPI0031E1E46B